MSADTPMDFDLRELLAHCAAGVLVDTKWVEWAEQQVAAGCTTPEMLALASVVLEPTDPWQTKVVTDLIQPALESLGHDFSNPDRLINDYALAELTQWRQGKRELWDVVEKIAVIHEAVGIGSGFQDIAYCAEMRGELDQTGECLLGDLSRVEASARAACEAKEAKLCR